MIQIQRLGFVYTVEHIGVDGALKSVERVHNIIPDEGIQYMLSASMKGGAQFSTWYIGLFENDRTPLAGDTMTSFIADCGESADYSNSTRPAAGFPAVTANALTTTASPTTFTFSAAATIMGGFLASANVIGGTTGLLLSAVKFNSPKVIEAGEILRVPVGLELSSL